MEGKGSGGERGVRELRIRKNGSDGRGDDAGKRVMEGEEW